MTRWAEPGTPVVVFSGDEDKLEPIGMGKYLGETTITAALPNGTVLGEYPTPVIVMDDDGEIILGCECWWCPA